MALNVVVIEGRLGKEPDIRQTQSGFTQATISVAVDRDYKSGDTRETDWITCVAWRQTADFIEKHFHKGDPIAVRGRIQTRRWTTDDGENRYATEVQVEQAFFTVGGRSGGSQNGGSAPRSGSAQPAPGGFADIPAMGDDEELPF
jgi:single-strand DNA-binding protein